MGSVTVTDSITLVPSGYTGESNLTADTTNGATNGYTNAESTTYARWTLSQASAAYVYYKFDTSAIPSNATITSITARGKARVNNTSRFSATGMQLYSGTTAKGSSTTFAVTTASTQNLSPGEASTWTRADLNDLRIRVSGTGSGSSTKRFDFYGADVTIGYSYTLTTYDVTISNSSSATVTVDNATPQAGETVVVTADTLNNITVTDNNTDVTNQFVLVSTGSEDVVPSSNTNTNFTLTDINNAYTGYDSNTSARLQVAGSTTGTIYFNFGSISLPSGATLQSVSCKATLQFSRNGSSSGVTSSFQMYAGNTAKGSANNWVTSATDVAKTTYDLTMGTWTTSDLSNPRFYITVTNSARSTVRYVYFYGATLTVTYQMASGGVYQYTISNVSSDHTIVVTGSGGTIDVTGVSLDKNTDSIEIGETSLLTATITPSNATDKSVSWSSSNTSVATVNSSGLVTAVAQGTAIITVVTTDGGFTDTCTITVTQPVTVDYILTDTLIAGKDYIIVNGNSGSVYAVSNEANGNATLKGVAVNVINSMITITESVESKIAFTCDLEDESNTNSTRLKNGSQYLYTDSSSGLRMFTLTSSADNKHWHYKADGKNLLWFFKDSADNTGYTDTSSTYKYYLTCTNGDYTDAYVSTTNLENTNTPEIFIFTKYDASTKMYLKVNGSWVQASKVYKKVNGSWVQQNDLTTVFENGVNYKTE